jgi:hypothetical protein
LEEIARDPLWQFVGVVVALVAIAVMVWQSLRSTHRIAFEYRIDSLATVADAAAGDVQILFKGQPVDHVQLVLIRLINIGSQAVRAADFEDRLRVRFGPDAQALNAEVAARNPANLDVRVSIEGAGTSQALSVEPLLLNRGDWFTVRAIVAGRAKVPVVEARIVDVSKIERLARDRESLTARVLRALLSSVVPISSLVFLGTRARTVAMVIGLIALMLASLVAGAFGSQWFDRRMDRNRL